THEELAPPAPEWWSDLIHSGARRRRAGAPGGGRSAAARPAVDRGRLERPHQPDVLCDARVPEALRLQPGEGDGAHAAGAPRGKGRRLERHAREGRVRRRPAPRARALGAPAPGLNEPPAPIKRTEAGDFVVRLGA